MTAPPSEKLRTTGAPIREEDPTRDLGAVSRAAAALLAAGPLIGAVESTPRVAVTPCPGGPSMILALQLVLDRLTERLGVRGIDVVAGIEGLNAAELVISGHLPLADLIDDAPALAALSDAAVDDVVAVARASTPTPSIVETLDGTRLRAYSAGDRRAPVVVVVSACGMPVGLVAGWMAGLAPTLRVLTWESRGLFDGDPAFDDRQYDLDAQAGDISAVLEFYGVERAHLMGLCGGAPIALAAASTKAVISLSLWHGDYELAGLAPKTQHQQDVQAMLTMAARGRAQAGSLCRLFERPATVAKLRPDLAHHIFYPYANPELLYRYGRLNGSIMGTDCGPLVTATSQPTLVVTSRQDNTAHPEGSIWVAKHLAAGRLEVMPAGDHLAAFDAAPALVELATAFIRDTMGETGP